MAKTPTRPALQALIFVPELVPQIQTGEKLNTVREGHRDYKEGQVLLGSPETNWCAMKTITTVTHTTIAKMARKDYLHQGWADRNQVLTDMQGYYPNLTMDSPITVVWWK